MKKLDQQGQVLVMFVLLLPIVLLGIWVVINQCYQYTEKQKLNDVSKIICQAALKELSQKELETLAQKNNVTLKKIEKESNEIQIELEIELKPILFSSKNTISVKRKCQK